jgi:ABC-type uncharacterized transport system permease subunit
MKKHKKDKSAQGLITFSAIVLMFFLSCIAGCYVESEEWFTAGILVAVISMLFIYVVYQLGCDVFKNK